MVAGRTLTIMATVGAPVLVLCSVLSVQTGQAIGKRLFDTVSPATVVALRLGMAAGLLLLIHRPTVPRRWRELRPVLGFGTAIAEMNLIYPALNYLLLGMATTLQLLGPITLAVATSRRLLDVALVATAGVGVWLLHAVPYSLELAALRRLPPRTVGVLQTLESASAGLAGGVGGLHQHRL